MKIRHQRTFFLILLPNHQRYRLNVARHVHFDVRTSRLSSGTCPRFCRFTIPASSGSVRQWELVYFLLPTLLYAWRLIPYRLNPDALLYIGNWSKELYRLNPIALNSVARRPPLPSAQSMNEREASLSWYVSSFAFFVFHTPIDLMALNSALRSFKNSGSITLWIFSMEV